MRLKALPNVYCTTGEYLSMLLDRPSASVNQQIKTVRQPSTSGNVSKINNDEIYGGERANKRTHSCSLCSKAFYKPSLAKRHERFHTKNEPFSCSHCDKAFSQRCHLKTHERIHANDGPFPCSFCDSTFSDSGNLKRHERTHKKERPFSCSFL